MAAWSSLLIPITPPGGFLRRADDPRLGEAIEFWQGDLSALKPGRAVLLGFPQDEGVSRNYGRPGAAEAPNEIRRWLYRLSSFDPESDLDLMEQPLLEMGNVRGGGSLEQIQEALGTVLAEILRTGAVPIVLGGGHETAYGHYLGYVAAQRRVGILNIDAHLDLRPYPGGQSHSGSPFRQAIEHPTQPLPGHHYVCLGAQPHNVSRRQYAYARQHGCVIHWRQEVKLSLPKHFVHERDRLTEAGCQIYVTLDADAVDMSEVPGVSTPNPVGLSGREVIACARLAGQSPQVASFDLVEINPRYDRDSQSARWGAVVVWNFLIGLSLRPTSQPKLAVPSGRRVQPPGEVPPPATESKSAPQAKSLSE